MKKLPNKQLTAKVKLNITDAEKKLDTLNRLFNNLDKATNRIGNNNKVEKQLTRSQNKAQLIVNKVKEWARTQNLVTSTTRSTNNALGGVWTKLKGIAATYLGIMGGRALIKTSDIITSAQNRLNNLNGGDKQLTQEQMDKMYVSANNARMAYTDMLSNASKSMTLAGDAFQGNMDNAIRFQEIMAKTYALGGASSEETSSSMYQMIQALGSGTLAGDELRSVREGAPLAYKAIENYVQGIMAQSEATKEFATKSLKDIAAEGLVTSDMVVAAVMDAGSKIDKQFEDTAITFGQTWDRIKNSAVKAFEPVSNRLNEMLNRAAKNGMFEKIETAFVNISKALQIAFEIIYRSISWIADNWNWLQYIVYAGITILIGHLLTLAWTAVKTAIISFVAFLINNPFALWILAIGVVLAFLTILRESCSNTCEFIVQVALIVANAIIAVLLIVLGVFLATGVVIMSIPVLIGLLIVGIIAALLALFIQFTGEIIGGALGIWEVIKAVCSWIGNGWSNMCNNLSSWFWNAIADMLDGVDWLLKGVNKIREALGMDAIDVGSVRAKANGYKSKVVDNKLDIGSAWDTGYSKGYGIGTNIQDKINSFKLSLPKGISMDSISEALGLDLGNVAGTGDSFPNANDPANSVANSYKSPSAEDLLSGIADDTGKISDAMDLTEEDLSYLREVANMEWKKEFTTATVVVDMKNNNTINGDGDLDGIVTRLADKLYEEMDYLANGVYA